MKKQEGKDLKKLTTAHIRVEAMMCAVMAATCYSSIWAGTYMETVIIQVLSKRNTKNYEVTGRSGYEAATMSMYVTDII